MEKDLLDRFNVEKFIKSKIDSLTTKEINDFYALIYDKFNPVKREVIILRRELTNENLLILLQESGWIVEVNSFENYVCYLPLKNNSKLI